MRHEDVYIASLGVQLGQLVRTPAAVRRGLLSEDKACRTRQRSVSVATETAAELAAGAANAALHSYSVHAGRRAPLGMHLHATMDLQPEAWTASKQVLMASGGTATAVTAKGLQVLDITATIMQARHDLEAVLISASAQFGRPRWDRYGSDYDVLYGDAGSAVVLTRGSGCARLLATATVTDPSLAGYTRGIEPDTAPGHGIDTPVDLFARKAAWLAANGGLHEFLRRFGIGVTNVVKTVLADADLSLEDIRWVLVPHLGAAAVDAQWLRPLGIDEARTQTHLGLHLGHLGPADQIVALHHLFQTGQLAEGDHVLLASAGAGLTWTAALVRIEVTS